MGGRGGATPFNRSTMSSGGITYQLDQGARVHGHELVEVSLDKVEQRWQRDVSYLPRDGSNDIGDRRARAREFIESGQTVNASRLYIDDRGRVMFEDGRHRVAALRDMGKRTIVVAVERRNVARAKRDLAP